MFKKIIKALKQRRVWASIGASLAFFLPIAGYTADFNTSAFVDSILNIIEGVGGLVAIILPIWSYYKPNK